MFLDEVRCLGEDSRLGFSDFALIVRIADVQMSVRNHKDGPFTLRLQCGVERLSGIGLQSKESRSRAAPFRNVERNPLLSKVAARQICSVVSAANLQICQAGLQRLG